MPCPIDPSHTVAERDVERHAARCDVTTRAARVARLPCYVRGCNAGSAAAEETSEIQGWLETWQGASAASASSPLDATRHPSSCADGVSRMLTGTSDDEFTAFVERVAGWYELHCASQSERAEGRASAGAVGSPAARRSGRHDRQSQLLVTAMVRAGILCPDGVALKAHPAVLDSTGDAAAPGGVGAPFPLRQLVLVEFGAGKGALGVAALRATAPSARAQLILLERGANRLKADRSRDGAALPLGATADGGLSPTPADVHRIRVDIADFALEMHPAARGTPLREFVDEALWRGASGHSMPAAPGIPWRGSSRLAAAVESVEPEIDPAAAAAVAVMQAAAHDLPHHVVGLESGLTPRCASVAALGKHLCGAATDFALRCLLRAVNDRAVITFAAGDEPDREVPARKLVGSTTAPTFGGVAIATCCHHACSWDAYVGKRFFREVLRASPVDFERMRMLSSWGLLVAPADMPSDVDAPPAPEVGSVGSRASERMSRSLMVRLGRQCKSLLDEGRATFLRACVPASAPCVVSYCAGSESPENMMLLASPTPA